MNTDVYKATVTPFRASLVGKLRGTILLPAVPRRQHAPVSISHGSRSDLPASVHASPICLQTSFEHARNFFRVTCGYLHANVIAKHQHEVRNLLVYIPPKVSRLAADLWPSRTSACHLRSYCEFFTDKKKVLILPTCVCTIISADMGWSILGCWGQVTAFLLIILGFY